MSSGIIVLGAGLAGLSAARHLGGECEVFEKQPHIGGHCHTRRVDGFNFDEGAHVFFGKDDCSREFVYEPLGQQLIRHRAEIWNNYGETRVGRYPVQANASALPAGLATRCVLDFIDASRQPDRPVSSYEDWCYASLGKTFADEFLLRYARKIWTVEPSEMNIEWLGSQVGGRISRPSLDQVIRGAIDREPQTLNYLTEFHYPDTGGFAKVAEPISAGLRNVHLGCGLTSLNAAARRLAFTDGSEWQYDALISTVPLPTLVALTSDAPDSVRHAAAGLMWTSLRCVNLGIARPDIGLGHWIYFYDHAIPFFRVSFPYKFAPSNAPQGHSSISCEIAYSRRKPLDDSNLVARVIDALRATGVLGTNDAVVVEDQVDVPYAYVVFDFNRTSALQTIHRWMEEHDIYPCGRFGEWGYHWSFEAMESGRRVAVRLAERLGIACQ